MYRPHSPSAFDIPELPTLRRMKPLPKRRRTSDPTPDGPLAAAPPSEPPHAHLHPHAQSTAGDASAEEAGTAAAPATAAEPALTAQMALQAYYMPVLGGVRELVKHAAPAEGGGLDLSGALAALGGGGLGLAYGGGGTGGGGAAGGEGAEDDDVPAACRLPPLPCGRVELLGRCSQRPRAGVAVAVAAPAFVRALATPSLHPPGPSPPVCRRTALRTSPPPVSPSEHPFVHFPRLP